MMIGVLRHQGSFHPLRRFRIPGTGAALSGRMSAEDRWGAGGGCRYSLPSFVRMVILGVMLRGLSIAFGLLVVVLVPWPAYAWGGVTHVQLGREFLSLYGDWIALWIPSILECTQSFYYGLLAPDRFLAKNLQGYAEHTHNWDRAFAMSRAAEDPCQEAFCAGYLMHLAADIVAHNAFVPAKITERSGARHRGHAYWELRFEHFQPEEAWTLARKMEHVPDEQGLDRLMERFQVPSVLSYDVNLRVTSRVMNLLSSSKVRSMVDRMDRRRATAIQESEAAAYNQLSLLCMKDIATHGAGSGLGECDPRGLSAISQARGVSRALATMKLAPPAGGTPSWSGDPWGCMKAVAGRLGGAARQATEAPRTADGTGSEPSSLAARNRSRGFGLFCEDVRAELRRAIGPDGGGPQPCPVRSPGNKLP